LKRYADAVEDLRAAVELRGPDVSVLKELGLCLRRAGRFDEAAENYKAAMRLDSADADLSVGLGDALLDAGLVDDAIAAFRSVSDGKKPQFTDIDWITRGDRLVADQHYTDAIAMYRLALEAKSSADAWRGLAQACYAAGQYDQAIEATTSAIKANPKQAETWIIRGWALEQSGRFQAGLKCFETVIDLTPHDETGWAGKARLLYKLERNEEAVAACRQAIKLSPSSPGLWSNLSAFEYTLGEREAALESAQHCLRLDPAHWQGLINAGVTLLALERLPEALEISERAIKADRGGVAGWRLKAQVLAASGEQTHALRTLEEAVSVVRSPQEALRSKAQMLSDEFECHAEALKVAKQALQMDPDSLTIACEYAELLAKTNHYAECRNFASQIIARETRPSRICAMNFITLVSYAFTGDYADYEHAFQVFKAYYLREFAAAGQKVRWKYAGLRSVIEDSSLADSVKFSLETLIDVQENRLMAKDVSYLRLSDKALATA
jgi:tetratricopeptide (TPR) repeat protein